MMYFLNELKSRNEILFWVAIIHLFFALLYLILTKVSKKELAGVNVWYKPFKFAASSVLYLTAMIWYCSYIPNFDTTLFTWANIIFFGFENIYIGIQAARGQASHFNLSNKLYSLLYSLMAIAATGITLGAAYILIKYFQFEFSQLPIAYLWSIRLGLFIFIIFAFQGFVMGARLTHSVGGENDLTTLPTVKWNITKGDLRVAHFIGMHALQVLPFLAYYLISNLTAIILISTAYFILSIFVLVQALQAKPFIKLKTK